MSEAPDEPGGRRCRALAAADAAPRCGARRKRTGAPCRAPAMPNGRCHKHGGASTGPRAAEGRARCRAAPWKHGRRAAEARAAARLRGEARRTLAGLRALLREPSQTEGEEQGGMHDAPVAALLGCVRGMAEGVDARLHARADRLARALEALRARLAALEEGDRAHAA